MGSEKPLVPSLHNFWRWPTLSRHLSAGFLVLRYLDGIVSGISTQVFWCWDTWMELFQVSQRRFSGVEIPGSSCFTHLNAGFLVLRYLDGVVSGIFSGVEIPGWSCFWHLFWCWDTWMELFQTFQFNFLGTRLLCCLELTPSACRRAMLPEFFLQFKKYVPVSICYFWGGRGGATVINNILSV